MKIAVLHPGAMGTSVAQALLAAGSEVFWVSKGRSDATRSRAVNVEELSDLDQLSRVDGVISVCPPGAAFRVAKEVIDAGFTGTYVDANAISPDTSRSIADVVTSVNGVFVDGGIIGPPANRFGATRLYLSGSAARTVATWFDETMLEAVPIAGSVTAASALKMCYAAYTKGTTALLLAIRALADAEGVTDDLIGEWNRSQQGLAARSNQAAGQTASKAWRFVNEMEEIAASFEAAGLPGDFHRGAAAVYRRLADLKDRPDVNINAVIDALLR